MITLFSPAESKQSGGSLPPIDQNAFCFESLYPRRKEAIDIYWNHIRNLDSGSLCRLTGIKNCDEAESFRLNPYEAPTMKAIERYSGVAYDYLKYGKLPEPAQAYIDSHVLIFSNVFGPIKASSRIPNYKLKQGESLGHFKPEQFYKTYFSESIDHCLADVPVLDLRAGFYEKFYTLTQPCLALKFIKDGKVVSHWAKAYRGIVLRHMALSGVKTEKEFEQMEIPGLQLVEIRLNKLKKEFVLNITGEQ